MHDEIRRLMNKNDESPGHILILDAGLTEESMDERPEDFISSRIMEQSKLVIVMRDGKPTVIKSRAGQ